MTCSLNKRKDGVWGTVVNNKTVGILSNLEDESADLVVSAFGLNIVRLPFIKPLPQMTAKLPSIFIKSEVEEDVGWSTFYRPFANNLWHVLTMVSIVHASWLFLTNDAFSNINVSTLLHLT